MKLDFRNSVVKTECAISKPTKRKMINTRACYFFALILIGFANVALGQTCVGTSVTYENIISTSDPFASVEWEVSPNTGYQNPSQASNGDFTVLWTTPGNYTVSVKELDNSSNTHNYSVVVQGAIGGTLDVWGTGTFCYGESATLTLTGEQGSSLTLENLTTGTTEVWTDEFTTELLYENTEYRISAYDQACNHTSESNILMLHVVPNYNTGVVSYASNDEHCEGNLVDFTATVSGYAAELVVRDIQYSVDDINWYPVDGFEPAPTSGFPNGTFSASSSVSVKGLFTSPNNCSSETEILEIPFYTPDPPVVGSLETSITGTKVCPETGFQIYVSENSEAVSFSWAMDDGIAVTPIGESSRVLNVVKIDRGTTFQVTLNFNNPCQNPITLVTPTFELIDEEVGDISISSGSIYIGQFFTAAYFDDAELNHFEISNAGEENWESFTDIYTPQEVGNYDVRGIVDLTCYEDQPTPVRRLQVKDIDLLIPGDIGENISICQGDYVNLGDHPAEGGNGFYSYTWQKLIDEEWEDVAIGGQKYATKESGLYRRKAASEHLEEFSNEVNVTVIPGDAGVIYGNSIRFQSGIARYSLTGYVGTILRWKIRYKDDLNDSWSVWDIITEDPDVEEISYYLEERPGGDRIYEIEAEVQTEGCSVRYARIEVLAKNIGMNFSHSYTSQLKLSQNIENVNDPSKVVEAITYFDGHGRKNLEVLKQASPALIPLDIAYSLEYDRFGHVSKNYLPYPRNVSDGSFDGNAIENQRIFYTNKFEADGDYAIIETRFTNAPLGQPSIQSSPGESWKIGNHNITYDYKIGGNEEVILWKFNSLLTESKTPYAIGDIFEKITRDEEDNKTIEYTNKEGQIILKKSYEKEANQWAKTYYIYDDFNQLRVVLPPEAVNRLNNEFFVDEANRTRFLNTWAFQYDYDGKRRMIKKKTPGTDSILMIYDKWDRLVLTQDGNQRKMDQWMFTSYDALNRPVVTGMLNDNSSRLILQNHINLISIPGKRYLTYDGSTDNHGYDMGAYPFVNNSGFIDRILTVTYYDNYSFKDDIGVLGTLHNKSFELSPHFDPAHNPQNIDNFHLEQVLQDSVIGLITGTKTMLLGDSEDADGYLETISYYDSKYRLIQVVSENHLGGTDVVSNQYDFIGNVRRVQSIHNDGITTIEQLLEYDYDHSNRLLSCDHKLNGNKSVRLYVNEYNELGELMRKKLHEEATDFAQVLDYEYNIRGWLKSINKSGFTPSPDPTDLFSMELIYNQLSPISNQ